MVLPDMRHQRRDQAGQHQAAEGARLAALSPQRHAELGQQRIVDAEAVHQLDRAARPIAILDQIAGSGAPA